MLTGSLSGKFRSVPAFDVLYTGLCRQEFEMEIISLSGAKAQLSELVDRAEAGESFEITRRGKPVARLTAVVAPRKPIDATLLQGLTAKMQPQPGNATDLVRKMRDDERY